MYISKRFYVFNGDPFTNTNYEINNNKSILQKRDDFQPSLIYE